MAVVLRRPALEFLSSAAEALAAETLSLEQLLGDHPELHQNLALPRPIRKVLARSRTEHACRSVRVMRFDFHPTFEGWRVSEVNSDVPGGYNEASGWTPMVSEFVSEGVPAADPAKQLVEAIAEQIPQGGTVALVHATAYTDDRQVMTFLARRLQQRGFRPLLVAPDHIEWFDGRATIKTDWFVGPADFVFRFFPAEWLPNLERGVKWQKFFVGAATPLCNPATALLSQSKRWPLVAEQLGIELPFWNTLLPETRDPREVNWKQDPDWVLKPALGRVGEAIGLDGITSEGEWKMIRRAVRWGANHWVAQRRFSPMPFVSDGQSWHICFGVYTVNGRAAGIYGRVAAQALINHLARDIAVLVERVGFLSAANEIMKTPAFSSNPSRSGEGNRMRDSRTVTRAGKHLQNESCKHYGPLTTV
jgi:glutathionylspermidine synthase